MFLEANEWSLLSNSYQIIPVSAFVCSLFSFKFWPFWFLEWRVIWGCALGFWDITRSWILFHLFFQLAVALFSCSMQVWVEMGVHVPTGPHCPDTCKGGGGHCSTGYCLMRDRNSAPCRLIPPYQEKQYQLAPLHTPLHCTAPGDGRVEVHCSAVPPRPWGVGGAGCWTALICILILLHCSPWGKSSVVCLAQVIIICRGNQSMACTARGRFG